MSDSDLPLTTESLAALSRSLARVIERLGEASTPKDICTSVGELVPVDFSAAFVLRRNSAPIPILDDIPLDAESVSYIESPYLLDPVYNSFLKGTLPSCCLLDDLCPDDFFESDYFLQYWSVIKIVSEFSFNAHYDNDTVIHVPVSRIKGSEPFTRPEQALFQAVSPVVNATMIRFWDARKASFSTDSAKADSFHQHLHFVLENFGSSMLTAREMDIMQLTMRGYSDKLSARELEITPGTVRNHKKSIFGKLQVSSQGQVFGLLLDVLQLPADDDIGPDPLATLLQQRQNP